MAEALPILTGLALGALVALCRGRVPPLAIASMVCLFAAAATLASGEFRMSWTYLVVDAAQVLSGFAVSLGILARLRPRTS